MENRLKGVTTRLLGYSTAIGPIQKRLYNIGETGARWSFNFIFENIYHLSVTNLNKLHVI